MRSGDVDPVTFTPLRRADVALLASWLARPHVARWWNHEFTPEAIERDFGDSLDGTEPTELWTVHVAGRPVGLLQWYFIADYPEYVEELEPKVDLPVGAASIDYFIGEPDALGHGVGSAMIAAAVDELWTREPPISCLIVPVSSANVASWKALLRAGFHLVGRADFEPDNPIDGREHEILRIDRPAARP